MLGIEVIVLLLLVRVMLLLGLILWIGEYVRRREIHVSFLLNTR